MLRKLFKGKNYSRAETIGGNTVHPLIQILVYIKVFFTSWYLKLRFVANTFWRKNPKTSHSEPMRQKAIQSPSLFAKSG